MHGKLYNNQSDKIVMNKNIISVGSRLTLHFKEATEITHPTIYISREKDVLDANYIHVEDLNRYYYIDNIEVEQQRFILHCSVDVLMSFKEYILAQECVVWRNENLYNLYLTDERLVTEAGGRVLTFPFKGGFSTGSKTGSYVLTMNGGGSTS